MENRYAIVSGGLVINMAISDAEFAGSQGWILAPDEVGVGWGYDGIQFIQPPPVSIDYSEQNKTTAMQLLQDTDWTATVDINDPVYSDPYLANQSAFLSYRSKVRQIAVNPPSAPVTDWPVMPQEEWLPGNLQVE